MVPSLNHRWFYIQSSPSAHLASCRTSDQFQLSEVGFGVTAPQQSNNPSEDLFTGIIVLALMLPGTDVTVIPTKSSVWATCYCLSQGIICYYYGFHWESCIMCTAAAEIYSETKMKQSWRWDSEENKTHKLSVSWKVI